MQAIDRMMLLINEFTKDAPGKLYSISELRDKTDLPISTIHRILESLVKHNLVVKYPTNKLYGLGSKWLENGLKLYDTMDYVSILRPELEGLMKKVKASVYLTKVNEFDSILIERIDYVNQPIYMRHRLGRRLALNKGCANLAILSAMDTVKAKSIINEVFDDKEKITIQEKINKYKVDGYVILKDENNKSISTIASAVVNPDNSVMGAVSIRLFDNDITPEIIQDVRETANSLSWKMAYKY